MAAPNFITVLSKHIKAHQSTSKHFKALQSTSKHFIHTLKLCCGRCCELCHPGDPRGILLQNVHQCTIKVHQRHYQSTSKHFKALHKSTSKHFNFLSCTLIGLRPGLMMAFPNKRRFILQTYCLNFLCRDVNAFIKDGRTST